MLIMMGTAGLLLIALDVWAIGRVQATRRERDAKTFWSILIVLVPVLGFAIWYVAGPRPKA